MRRVLCHIGIEGDVTTACEEGTRVRVLCGRRVHPLSPDDALTLPLCPRCRRKSAANYLVLAAKYVYTYYGSAS